jgi:flagellar biosynthesis GTPase FlhF
MNQQGKNFFTALSKDRAESADVHDKPSERGYWKSVVDKYSEQAHFIYELLQNADDCKATQAQFTLKKDGLIFIHNGKDHFTVSDPKTEREDTRNKKLGHINSICSIGNSTKTEQSIGKFGLGFKSVLQFTQTPHIYDRDFQFTIKRFIVPAELNESERKIFEHIERQENETIFWFPFDHEKTENSNEVTDLKKLDYFETWNNRQRIASEAHEDISKKLKNLTYPTLFLTNLQAIIWQIESENGIYRKKIKEAYFKNEIRYSLIDTNNDSVWLFSKKIILKGNEHEICVGFFLDDNKKLIEAQQKSGDDYQLVFCFFPIIHTNTQLKFIIHAPFLLNDSRDVIMPLLSDNEYLTNCLAKLAADSLLILRDMKLIDDNIINIIPYKESDFTNSLFKPIFDKIKEKFQNEDLLPAKEGKYVSKQNAYWFQDNPIIELFSDKQLQQLTGNFNARWVFHELPRNKTDGEKETIGYNTTIYPKRQYIDSCVVNSFTMDILLGRLSKSFIEKQEEKWLHRLYAYLNKYSDRAKIVRKSPIFLDQNGNAVSARDSDDKLILFLQDADISDYITIKTTLLENKITREFIKALDIERPKLRDEIYTKIIPAYNSNDGSDTNPYFAKFFKYFKECPNSEMLDFIKLIRDIAFLRYKAANDEKIYRAKAMDIYMPTEDLKAWFETKLDTKFLCLEDYQQLVDVQDKECLDDFLQKLGVHYTPIVSSVILTWQQANDIGLQDKGNYGDTFTDKCIDGLSEFFDETFAPEKSQLLWCVLLGLDSNSWAQGIHEYHAPYARYNTTEYFDSITLRRLRSAIWILNKDGNLVSASDVTIQTLSDTYNTISAEALAIIKFLEIREAASFFNPETFMTPEQKEQFELGKIAKESGLSASEIQAAIEDAKKKKQRQTSSSFANEENIDANTESSGASPDNGMDNQEVENLPPSTREIVQRAKEEIHSRKSTSFDISVVTNKKQNQPYVKTPDDIDNDDSFTTLDEDDYTKPTIDFSKKIEQAKQRSAHEIAEIARLDELTQQALGLEKYSYGWFKVLLELESLNSGENNANSREISIAFSKVELEEGTSRTFVLKHPNRYIPQSMEDLADIPLELHFADQPTVKVAIEGINVKSYTLRAKLKTNARIDDVDLSLVTEAKIDTKNPVFLLEELRKAFNELNLDDNYNMRDNLCKNIEFVFGPPGTGKTTHLAKNVILPIMCEANDLKILVLTPTNKAADVLVRRLMEVMGTDHSYTDWLIRFGTANDTNIEQSGVFRDKTFDIRTFPRNVTVTTIARFPYDYFMPDEGTRLHLKELKWDYIIIDEASMIPLVNIIYPLYKKTPEKFIIAGDPFQIEPITGVDIWKNENIYTMVELKSFTEPTTIPHQYHVELLTTQYRSIPAIGEVFSSFAYGGVLNHNRTSDSQRPLLFKDTFDVKSLNIIKFPVVKYESIYRPKKLKNTSNYQIYSALFAFEFVKYLSSLIEKANGEENFRIGLITPYRAQSDLIDKLMASIILPRNIDVQAGTIHGFQGDECDIIIALFNPPPLISNSKDMFLNKLNIINVSISRARDYLFVIMPDDEAENVNNLKLIKNVEKICKEQPNCIEWQSHMIEKLIFGSQSYLEDNSFSTSHQLVNVYRKPEKRYEVRSEDSAIDVQIHE